MDYGEPLSNVDAAWLRMEDRTNLMIITAVMSFHERVDFKLIKAVVEDRLLCYERFRQRVVESRIPFGRPRWVDDQHFDLHAHLYRTALPEPGGKAELQEMVSQMMSTPLDYTKPLWQFQFIENYRGGCALVARIHHCIGDGIALVRVMLGMTDDTPGTPNVMKPRPRSRKPPGGGIWMPEVVNDALRSMRKLTGTLVEDGMESLPTKAAGLAAEGLNAAGVLGRLVTMPPDPPTVFKGALHTAKRCAWSEILPLDQVKAFSKTAGATINDLLLTGVAGALRRDIIRRGGDTRELNIRAVIPVNLRPDDAYVELGNRFGLVFLSLPVGIVDWRERLAELKQRMDAIKGSAEAVVSFAVLQALGTASPEIEGVAVGLFGSKATAVMTNVPGPRKEIYLAGKPVRSLMFWVPQSARLGLGVSILSYAGQVRLGIATDAVLAPDPGAIIEAFQDEMYAMLEIERDTPATA